MKRLLLFTACAMLILNGCKDADSEPNTPTKIDINGTWVATGYSCPVGTAIPGEAVSIVENKGVVTATKVTGDPCVPAGNVTFKGTYDEAAKIDNIKWTTGTASNPASNDNSTGTLTVVDKDNLKTTFTGNLSITFKRQ